MSNGFFSVPLHSDSQPWLAFTVDYEQYQWTRLPQGFRNSPTIYHQAVRRDLCDPECPVKQSTMIQYVDDILIASTDHEVHQTELASLLDYLHKKDTNAAFTKLKSLKSKSHFWVKQLVQEIDPLHRIERLQSKPYLRLLPLKHSAHF